jgi:hypothetical protein
MGTQDKTVHKKRMGRPPGVRYGETIPARFEIENMKHLDSWAKKHDVSRSEAIRQLVALGLTVKARPKQPSSGRARKADEMAAKQLDQLVDKSAPTEEQESRKQRLLKAPEEFRNVRVDRAKAKAK